MRFKKYIVLLWLMFSSAGVLTAQQYMSIVCTGDTGVAYHVQGSEGSTFNWNVQGGTISRNFGDSVIVNWGLIPGEYTMTVQETSKYGCPAQPVSGTVLVSAPDLSLGDDTYICSGETFEISPEGTFYSYLWSDGSALPVYSTSTEGWISCEVTDVYGCPAVDSIYLTVRDLPYVELGRDTSLCGSQSMVLSGGPDASSFLWSTGELSPEITVFQGFQVVSVLVTDVYGCQNSDTVTIRDCDPNVFFRDIPTAITPNGDGKNDTWRIEKLEAYPDAEIDIYDRWGRLVFRSDPGYSQPWDGTDMSGKELPMDSYHFVIRLNFGNDDRIIGIVTIVK